MSTCSFTTSTAANSGGTPETEVDRDVIQTHILPRLDGSTLAFAACVSRRHYTLCTQEKLWRDICNSTWTSIGDLRVRHVISTFPAGYRSFFSDACPATFHRSNSSPPSDHQHRPSLPSELISAVDIHYENELICSKVVMTETSSKDFTGTPLWIELFEPKETAPVPVMFEGYSHNDDFLTRLERSMKLSWIMMDPARKRAANLSSQRPVSMRRHLALADQVQLVYVKVLPGDSRVGSSEFVECRIVVTCEGEEGGEMRVREVYMHVEDMDGVNLSREDSSVILQEAMWSERKKEGKGREMYEEFLEMKRDRRERRERREERLERVCMIIRFLIFGTLLCGFVVSLN